MGKERKSKRQLVRDEKRAKKRARELENEDARQETKRQRKDQDAQSASEAAPDFMPLDDDDDKELATSQSLKPPRDGPEKEFFGMLAEEEQEYFRRADELLEM